jgi:hypothetical protein
LGPIAAARPGLTTETPLSRLVEGLCTRAFHVRACRGHGPRAPFLKFARASVWLATGGNNPTVAAIASKVMLTGLVVSLLGPNKLEDETPQPLAALEAVLDIAAVGAALYDVGLSLW